MDTKELYFLTQSSNGFLYEFTARKVFIDLLFEKIIFQNTKDLNKKATTIFARRNQEKQKNNALKSFPFFSKEIGIENYIKGSSIIEKIDIKIE